MKIIGMIKFTNTIIEIISDNKEVKNPSLTLNRQVNLYPLTNYTFGTKGKNNTQYVIFEKLQFYVIIFISEFSIMNHMT